MMNIKKHKGIRVTKKFKKALKVTMKRIGTIKEAITREDKLNYCYHCHKELDSHTKECECGSTIVVFGNVRLEMRNNKERPICNKCNSIRFFLIYKIL